MVAEARSAVFAPDSFKGSIGAAAAAAALAAGWGSVRPADLIVLRPVADGGEGTLDAFAAAVPGAQRMSVVVRGPDGRATDASWLLLPSTPEASLGTAVVELASTSGMELLGDRRLPWDADTTGFGQAIVAALDSGVSRLVLGIGSSASTEGGIGLLTALGARFTDAAANPVAPGARGLLSLADADLEGLRPLPPGGVLVLSDVTNPLLGLAGAAAVFGPQKGLGRDDVPRVDDGLSRLAGLLPADPQTPGAGAAGGTGFALLAWGARLVPGAAEVAELVGLRDALAEASVVITGEGSYDGQSAAGKAPAHVAALATESGVPVALAAGRITEDASTSAFAATVSLTDLAGSTTAALHEPARWLREAGAVLARSL
ncbi:glycerate kinase [Microbacterium sp. 4R-513]|uniref:glycerate kinase n=1 Tax=Microbacterium sp. 4R-513 TaxID=2567934 RepID=UPI0013E1FE54|nr:glycerate kinase [Microbacterium sp. 4R-513]QIG39332.1 glycerate kinase [Microbacterium sp. 4R-513]